MSTLFRYNILDVKTYNFCFNNRNTSRQQQQSATLLPSRPHPPVSTTSEQHKNNWKEKEKKRRKSSTLLLWGPLHKWHGRLLSSVPGVNQVGNRCQSTGRSQTRWRQLVDCPAVWGLLQRYTEVYQVVILWSIPSTFLFLHASGAALYSLTLLSL